MQTQPANLPAQPSSYLPLLQTSGCSLLWGECEGFRIWMSLVTFNKYVQASLITKYWRHENRPFPTDAQVLEIMNENLYVSAWKDAWKLGDPEIHFFPKQMPG